MPEYTKDLLADGSCAKVDKVRLPKNEDTPQKTNMSPESQWLEDVFPIEIVLF